MQNYLSMHVKFFMWVQVHIKTTANNDDMLGEGKGIKHKYTHFLEQRKIHWGEHIFLHNIFMYVKYHLISKFKGIPYSTPELLVLPPYAFYLK